MTETGDGHGALAEAMRQRMRKFLANEDQEVRLGSHERVVSGEAGWPTIRTSGGGSRQAAATMEAARRVRVIVELPSGMGRPPARKINDAVMKALNVDLPTPAPEMYWVLPEVHWADCDAREFSLGDEPEAERSRRLLQNLGPDAVIISDRDDEPSWWPPDPRLFRWAEIAVPLRKLP